MNPEYSVLNRVQLIHNVHADKHAQLENVEQNVIQEHVRLDNFVKMELVLLVVEQIWIVTVKDLVLTDNV